jgi:DNA-binding Lrp family transcriptional regulator
VRERLAEMLETGLVRRIGAVPNHYRLGYTANGMSVWDVDDARVDAWASASALPGVSHCYRRPRKPARWPYNLFAMLHGRSRDEVEAAGRAGAAPAGPACRAHDILYSTAILKKTGLRLTGGSPDHVPHLPIHARAGARRGHGRLPPAGPRGKPPGPVVIWNLIRRCNLTCKHCYASRPTTTTPAS